LYVEELADVLEVLRALADELEVPWDDVERERVRKRDERGAFHDGWLLTLPDAERPTPRR
jgi:predicted house-cleaning noncanonical NTP pyrophosphatase (MazG superfamily)